MRLVHEAVEDGVCQRRVADRLMPQRLGKLAGDHRGARLVTILKDLQQVAPLVRPELLPPAMLRASRASAFAFAVGGVV